MTKFKVGTRVDCSGIGSAVIVYAKSKHSVKGYNKHALICIDHDDDIDEHRHDGWGGKESDLVPDDAPHLREMHNLLWVQWKRLTIEELLLDYEVDQ